jgi:tetratricopeptide (TPR) repeat protein
MSATVAHKQSDLDTRIREAEMYQSMGLLEASLEIYCHLLSDSKISDLQMEENIQGRITSLRTQIQELEKEEVGTVPQKELSILQASIIADETPETLMESAAALKELGLFKESVIEYEKAFTKDPFAPDLVNRLMNCLCQLLTPRQIVDHLSNLIHAYLLRSLNKPGLFSPWGLSSKNWGKRIMRLNCINLLLKWVKGTKKLS